VPGLVRAENRPEGDARSPFCTASDQTVSRSLIVPGVTNGIPTPKNSSGQLYAKPQKVRIVVYRVAKASTADPKPDAATPGSRAASVAE